MNIIIRVKQLTKKYGITGYIRFIFYPITLLGINTYKLAKAIWNSRVLINGNWGDYPHFSPYWGFLSVFYWWCFGGGGGGEYY